MVWNEETIRHLRELWSEGLSTAEIGRRLGVSKNAIVGKAHRLDLDARPSPIRRDTEKAISETSREAPQAGTTLPPLASVRVLATSAPAPAAVHAVEAPQPAASPVSAAALVAATPAVTVMARPAAVIAAGPAAAVASAPAAAIAVAPAITPTPVFTPVGAPDAAPVSNIQPLRAVQPPAERPALAVVAPVAVTPVRHFAPPPAAPMQVRRSAPSCCWPIGEPGTKSFKFCDDLSLPGKPYCDEHARLAYVKIRDRKEDAA